MVSLSSSPDFRHNTHGKIYDTELNMDKENGFDWDGTTNEGLLLCG